MVSVHAATMSRGDIILLVVAVIVLAAIINLIGERVCHQGRFWTTRDRPVLEPNGLVYDWAVDQRRSDARLTDWAADQGRSDAQLTALASTFRALDERPALVRSLVDERAARSSLGYPNVFPFIRKNDRPAA